MTGQEAINILASATEPGVKLSRVDYIHVQAALEELNKMVQAQLVPPAPEMVKG